MLTEVFYHVDNFCKEYEKHLQKIQLKSCDQSKRGPKQKLCLSEIMTIVIYFHHSKFRTFKNYYLFLKMYHSRAFTHLTSYNRFVELKKQSLIPLMIFLSISCSGIATNISFIDTQHL